MLNLKDATVNKITLEKRAAAELPKDVSQWNNAILEAFYNDVSIIPPEAQVNLAISNIDEEQGYAKGSVVVAFGNSAQINFPIIVKDFKLYPFDVFYGKDDKGQLVYMNASDRNISRIASNTSLGSVAFHPYIGDDVAMDLKMPGNVAPKVAIEGKYSTILAAAMKGTEIKDLEKLAADIAADKQLVYGFGQNTQGRIASYFTEANRLIHTDQPENDATDVIDMDGVFKAKKMLTVLDNEFFDAAQLKSLKPSNICEVRVRYIPDVKDFMASTENANDRIAQFKNGIKLTGLYVSCVNLRDLIDGEPQDMRRTTVFITADKKYIIKKRKHDKLTDMFGITVTDKNYPNDIKMVDALVNDLFSDKLVTYHGRKDIDPNTFAEAISGSRFETPAYKRDPDGHGHAGRMSGPVEASKDSLDGDYIGIYGSNGNYFCINVGKVEQVMYVNERPIIKNEEFVIIPAKIKVVEEAKTIDDPAVKLAIGNVKKIYLVPNNIRYLNIRGMTTIDRDRLIEPAAADESLYEKEHKAKEALGRLPTTIKTASIKLDTSGKFLIKSAAVRKINRLGGIDSDTVKMSHERAKKIMEIMGMEKTAATKAMLRCIELYKQGRDPICTAIGINDDFIEKTAAEKFLGGKETWKLKEAAAEEIQVNLVKEASLLQDPEAVDVVLSLNFINKNNLMDFVVELPKLQEVSNKLAEMLIGTRMGLKFFDETALRNCIDGLEKVITGLEKLKLAIGA